MRGGEEGEKTPPCQNKFLVMALRSQSCQHPRKPL